MTTIAMGAGMMPIALGLGVDPSFRAPMAIVVIGGLITSTFLSLLVIPVVFTYVDDARAEGSTATPAPQACGAGRSRRRRAGPGGLTDDALRPATPPTAPAADSALAAGLLLRSPPCAAQAGAPIATERAPR